MSVGGRDHPASGVFDVLNPATGSVLAHAPAFAPEDLSHVFGVAESAFQTWRSDESARRAALRVAADALETAEDVLATLLTAEQGKPLREARSEIKVSATWLRYYADLEVPREIIRDDERGYEEVLHRPLGVVAAITPWNYPVTLAVWKIAPALRAGNTMVVKPSPYTPLTTLAIGELLRGVLPDGVFNVITGVEPLGADMVAHPIPRKVTFTGSTPVGKRVAVSAAGDLKRVTLELGGNDPAIVLPGANIERIAKRLFWGAFRNSGQTCFAIKRVYAHESIHDQLVDAVAAIARTVTVDDGMADGVELGPINNRPQLQHVDDLVQDALRSGGRAAAGGTRIDRRGYFFEPTIIDRVEDGVRVVDEEQFGPVLPIVEFRDTSDAVARANHSPFGLTASVWSEDTERAMEVAAQLDSGQVSVNSHGAGVQPHLPFGGHKWSGVGVENGIWGLHSFTDTQVVTGPARRREETERTGAK